MIHSGNILTFMALGIILMPAATIAILALWMAYKDDRKAKQNRKTHRRIQTHYERLQARLLAAGGSITSHK
jgi:hypothetical protein